MQNYTGTRLPTVNHRRSFPIFFSESGRLGAISCYHSGFMGLCNQVTRNNLIKYVCECLVSFLARAFTAREYHDNPENQFLHCREHEKNDSVNSRKKVGLNTKLVCFTGKESISRNFSLPRPNEKNTRGKKGNEVMLDNTPSWLKNDHLNLFLMFTPPQLLLPRKGKKERWGKETSALHSTRRMANLYSWREFQMERNGTLSKPAFIWSCIPWSSLMQVKRL